MGNIEFAWDRRKARSNLKKHGVSFEEAQAVFLDDNARLIDDPDHSEEEERFLLLGYSFQARCLIVNHCYRRTRPRDPADFRPARNSARKKKCIGDSDEK